MENGALEFGIRLGLKLEVGYPRFVVVAGFGADWMELQVLVSCHPDCCPGTQVG